MILSTYDEMFVWLVRPSKHIASKIQLFRLPAERQRNQVTMFVREFAPKTIVRFICFRHLAEARGVGPDLGKCRHPTVFQPLKILAGPRTQDFKSASEEAVAVYGRQAVAISERND